MRRALHDLSGDDAARRRRRWKQPLYEEVVYDEDGNNLTGSLADYILPTAAEIPAIEIIHLETVSPETLTGAKGLGEDGAIGAEIDELPATPARIRALLRGRTPRL